MSDSRRMIEDPYSEDDYGIRPPQPKQRHHQSSGSRDRRRSRTPPRRKERGGRGDSSGNAEEWGRNHDVMRQRLREKQEQSRRADEMFREEIRRQSSALRGQRPQSMLQMPQSSTSVEKASRSSSRSPHRQHRQGKRSKRHRNSDSFPPSPRSPRRPRIQSAAVQPQVSQNSKSRDIKKESRKRRKAHRRQSSSEGSVSSRENLDRKAKSPEMEEVYASLSEPDVGIGEEEMEEGEAQSEREEGEHEDQDDEEERRPSPYYYPSRSKFDSVNSSHSSSARRQSSSEEEVRPEEDYSEQSSSSAEPAPVVSSSSSSSSSSDDDDDDVEEEEETREVPAQPEETASQQEEQVRRRAKPWYLPSVMGCRSVEEFTCLNRIEEGTYGVVYRARDKKTDEVVALKRLKMEKEREGFPITSLREINTLLKAQHPNIVTVREIVVGSNMDKIYIVMGYVEHDLKSLMEVMKEPFMIGEVKTLMMQLLSAVAHLHDNWILHRDLKTSNLLLSHKGILKVGDFGLAREYGSPLRRYTPIVVTLWYRAVELLLGQKLYSTAVDMWSVGCIFAELLLMKPLFPGKGEANQLNLIFRELGTPNERIWPGFTELPLTKKLNLEPVYQFNSLRKRFPDNVLSELGFDLMNKLLTYYPDRRISADEALKHAYFSEKPHPIAPHLFPTWPAKSEGASVHHKKNKSSPTPPSGGLAYSRIVASSEKEGLGFRLTADAGKVSSGNDPGFTLKF